MKAPSLSAAKAGLRTFKQNLVEAHPGVSRYCIETYRAKGSSMPSPSIFQGDSPMRLVQGAIAGALATLVIGFYWGGWVTGGTARERTQKDVSTALVSALSPICVDKFQQSAEAKANLVELKKVSSWQQGAFIEKGGWANMPGGEAASTAVAQECATLLGNLEK